MTKTHSEELFEKFCTQNGLTYTPIPVPKQRAVRTPDYEVNVGTHVVIAEVKEIGDSPENRERVRRLDRTGSTGAFDPRLDAHVRQLIHSAMPQLRRLAKGKYPGLVIVHSGVSLLPIDGIEVRLAMYGKDIVEIVHQDSHQGVAPIVTHRFGGSRQVTENHNTTLSAVGIIEEAWNAPIRIDFYHNKFAAIPFPPDWLRLSCVQHFQIGSQQQSGGLIGWEPL